MAAAGSTAYARRGRHSATHEVPANIASLHVTRDHEPPGGIEGATGIGGHRLVRGVMQDGHESSSKRARSFVIAIRMRDLPVPSGIPRALAISACGASSKNDNSITLTW